VAFGGNSGRKDKVRVEQNEESKNEMWEISKEQHAMRTLKHRQNVLFWQAGWVPSGEKKTLGKAHQHTSPLTNRHTSMRRGGRWNAYASGTSSRNSHTRCKHTAIQRSWRRMEIRSLYINIRCGWEATSSSGIFTTRESTG
jgi:hypothetical protein